MTIFTITTWRGEAYRTEFRTVGLFETAELAFKILNEGWGDLNEEGHYPIAIVEEVVCGLYPTKTFIASYLFHEGKWEKTHDDPRLPPRDVDEFLKKHDGFATIG